MSSPKLIRGTILKNKDAKHLQTLRGGYIHIRDGIIQDVFERLPEGLKELPCEDFGDKLLIPGLVDLHVHAPQYAFRGTGMDLELLDWLNTYTFPEEGRYAELDYARRAYQLFVEGLTAGATTRACVFATTHIPATLELMELLEKSGLATLVGKVNMDRDCPRSLRESVDGSLSATETWLEACGSLSRTKPILTPRFVPSCTEELLAGLGGLQRRHGLPVQSHLSENPAEVELVKGLCPDARSYAGVYARHGLFGGEGCPTVMAHCVYCTGEEMDLMAQNRVFVAHCPQSNTNLASGIAPAREYLSRGIPMGLGTDVAGGASLSMFRAVTDAIQVSKLRWRLVDGRGEPLTFPEALWLATAGGGAFFGKVGRLEAGYACDLLALDDGDLPTPRPLSPAERLERVFYLGGDRNVAAKYVAGRRVK